MCSIDFSKIDLAFILDTTSSMSSYINHAKKNITKICEEIIKSEKCNNLRVALVNYRDHPPQDNTYVTDVYEFLDDIEKIKEVILKTNNFGGGDLPEAICCGLNDCYEQLSWRIDSVKIAILIADAPPHGLGISCDSMADGCPLKNDPVEIAHKMATKGITLYCAGCEPSLNPYRQFFIALCLITGGKYVSLDNVNNLTNVIIGGTREEISMEKAMAQIHNDIMREAAEKGERVNEENLTKRVHELLNSKNNIAKINEVDSGNQIMLNEHVKEMSKLKNLDEIKNYVKNKKITLEEKSTISSIIPTPSFFKNVTTRKIIRSSKIVKKKYVAKSLSSTKRRTKSSRNRSVTVVLRRSERIKEIEKRKQKTETNPTNGLKSVLKRKRNIKIKIDDDKKNKRIRTDSETTTLVPVPEEKFDENCARRLAKKVIARNFNKIDSF